MKVTLVGFDNTEEYELRKATTFFGGILFGPKLKKKILIQIQHDPNLSEQGECWPEDDDYRKFVISIRAHFVDFYRGLEDDPISTIAHEMTHCWQWATGKLRAPLKVYKDLSTGEDRSEFYFTWEGKRWRPKAGDTEALDSPWEHDAYGHEVCLYKRWQLLQSLNCEKN